MGYDFEEERKGRDGGNSRNASGPERRIRRESGDWQERERRPERPDQGSLRARPRSVDGVSQSRPGESRRGIQAGYPGNAGPDARGEERPRERQSARMASGQTGREPELTGSRSFEREPGAGRMPGQSRRAVTSQAGEPPRGGAGESRRRPDGNGPAPQEPQSRAGAGTSGAGERNGGGPARRPQPGSSGQRSARPLGTGSDPQRRTAPVTEKSESSSTGLRVSRARGGNSRTAGGSGADGYGRRTADGGRVTATSQAAEKAEKTAKNRKRRRIITMVAAEILALIFIFTYAYFARTWNLMQGQPDDWDPAEVENPVFSVDVPDYMKGHWTFAVFGVDSRDKNVLKGTNSDVIIICDLNRDTGEIKLVSLFRDTYLNTDDKGSYNKINQAYFVGGPTQAIKALNKNLDLNITDYVTFNWSAVANGINVLGGVDMELSKAEFYYINSFITETVKGTGIGSHQLTHAGMNHLDGVQAVAYGRLRLMDTDYARTERQRKVIEAAFNKAVKADWNTLNSLVGAVLPNVSTSVDVTDIFGLLKNITNFHIGETAGFPFSRGDANMGKKGACVIPTTLESNVVKLHEFLFGETDYVPSDTVKEISAKIASDTGLYKEGATVGHVSTDNGVIPSTKAPATEAETEKEEETTKAYKKGEDGFYYDEDGNRYDEDRNLVDEQGRRIDEDGYLIDGEGFRIDEDGNRIDDYIVDEDGNTIYSNEGARPPETDVDGNEIIDGEWFGENGEWIGGGRWPNSRPGGGSGRPNATVPSTEGSSRPGWPTRPTSPSRPTSPAEPTASPTRPYPGGTEPTTEGVGPGTGLEPGSTTGPGIIDNSSNSGSEGYVDEGPGAVTEPGGAGPGTSPGSPVSPGGTSPTISPIPTQSSAAGPGM